MAELECKICKKKDSAEVFFVYNDENFCSDCLFPLIYAMAEDGHLNLDHDDMEEKGVTIEF